MNGYYASIIGFVGMQTNAEGGALLRVLSQYKISEAYDSSLSGLSFVNLKISFSLIEIAVTVVSSGSYYSCVSLLFLALFLVDTGMDMLVPICKHFTFSHLSCYVCMLTNWVVSVMFVAFYILHFFLVIVNYLFMQLIWWLWNVAFFVFPFLGLDSYRILLNIWSFSFTIICL